MVFKQKYVEFDHKVVQVHSEGIKNHLGVSGKDSTMRQDIWSPWLLEKGGLIYIFVKITSLHKMIVIKVI